MNLKVGIRLTKKQVLDLLTYFDDSSDSPLHEGLDFDSYGEKLSLHAYFILALDEDRCLGFLAYYLNEDGKFVYVPQVVVHRTGRHKGVGHHMFSALYSEYSAIYNNVKLEVLETNQNGRNFYEREGFVRLDRYTDRLLLEKRL